MTLSSFDIDFHQSDTLRQSLTFCNGVSGVATDRFLFKVGALRDSTRRNPSRHRRYLFEGKLSRRHVWNRSHLVLHDLMLKGLAAG
jgi:hypothetical protein